MSMPLMLYIFLDWRSILSSAGLNSKKCGQAFRDGRDRLVVRDLRTWLLFGAPAFRLSTISLGLI